MSPELERRLVDTYPKLFTDCGVAQNRSSTAFVFECDDGWFDLIDVLCAQLSTLDPIDEGEGLQLVRAVQIKEKYGTLRFYVGPVTDEAAALINFAEGLSARICETCGNRGRTHGIAWLKTLCDPCAHEQSYAGAEAEVKAS